MSYIRPLEHNAGLYIYPESGGIRFLSFPEKSDIIFPDEMLDILLLKMSNEEILNRRKHGQFLLESLEKEDFNTFSDNKDFWKEDKKW